MSKDIMTRKEPNSSEGETQLNCNPASGYNDRIVKQQFFQKIKLFFG